MKAEWQATEPTEIEAHRWMRMELQNENADFRNQIT